MAEPKASSVFAPQQRGFTSFNPLDSAAWLFDYLSRAGRAPQQPNEANIVYGTRKAAGTPFALLQDAQNWALREGSKAFSYAGQTPADVQQANQQKQASLPPWERDAGFQSAWQFTAQAEGGYNPRDNNGAPVNFGINQGANPDINVKDLTPEKAKQLAYERYWVPSGAGKLPKELQAIHFDTYYLNPSAAQRMLKESGGDPGRYIQLRNQFLNSIEGPHKGWNNRTAALARHALGQNLISPFSTQYADQALGELGKAEAAAKQTSVLPFQTAAMPEVPEPSLVPKTDFSASDARLEAMKPIEMTMKEAEGMRWKNFWGGLGQAMMSSPEGEGLGSFFLRLGGAGLASVGQTMSDIEAKKEQYEMKLAKWQAAMYENDFTKAQVQQRELMADWQSNQNWALEKYRQGMEVWGKTAFPTLQGNNLVFTQFDAKSGKGSVTVQPIEPLVTAAYAAERSNIMMQAFGVENQANASVARVANGVQGQIALAQAGQVMADERASPQEKAAAAAFGPIRAVQYAVDTNQIASVMGADEAELLNEDIMNSLTQTGVFPGQKGYEEAYKRAATGRLLTYVMQSPDTMSRLMSTMGGAAQIFEAYDRYAGRKERTTINSKGQRSIVYEEEGE